MASKKNTLVRGDKRLVSIKIVRANRLSAKSTDETKTKVIGLVQKSAQFKDPSAARAMVNWIIRPVNKKKVERYLKDAA